uniref:Inturned planar cell polarity effector homolog n=1 Tax=Cacopsylla melanoneura TaxID=428564 RepID=A0A8D8TEG4_9HEMI
MNSSKPPIDGRRSLRGSRGMAGAHSLPRTATQGNVSPNLNDEPSRVGLTGDMHSRTNRTGDLHSRTNRPGELTGDMHSRTNRPGERIAENTGDMYARPSRTGETTADLYSRPSRGGESPGEMYSRSSRTEEMGGEMHVKSSKHQKKEHKRRFSEDASGNSSTRNIGKTEEYGSEIGERKEREYGGEMERKGGRQGVEETTGMLRDGSYDRGHNPNVDRYNTPHGSLGREPHGSLGGELHGSLDMRSYGSRTDGRRNLGSGGRDFGSLNRSEDVLAGGSLRRDEPSLRRDFQLGRELGRAGSEMNIARGNIVASEPRVMGRAASVNADLNVGRIHELQNIRDSGLSEARHPHNSRRIDSNETRNTVPGDGNIPRGVNRRQDVVKYMERVAPDNYCSSCGEEDDLNESLLTTTTNTSASDQTATYSSSSNSISQEAWENDVQPDGSLLYISCYYKEIGCATYEGNEILNRIQQRQQCESAQAAPVPVSSILKPIDNNRHENRIIKLIRKKSMSKKSSLASSGTTAKVKKATKLNIEIPSITAKKLKNYIPYEDPRDVCFELTQNLNLGRRATLAEIKLGLQLDESGEQLRVVDIIPDSTVYHSKLVQLNDLLLAINERPVSKHNLTEVLAMTHHTGQVKLRVQATKNKHELARDRNNYKSKIVKEVLAGVETYDRSDMCCVYVNTNGIQYKYPPENNNLTNSFGLFLTLNNLFNNTPLYCGTSSVECDSYVIFSRDKQAKNSTANNLLLVCFPHQQFTSYDLCLKLNKLIVSCVRFMFGYDLDSVFASNTASTVSALNRLFSFLFHRLLVTQGSDCSAPANVHDGNTEKVSNEEYIKICKAESYTPLQEGGEQSLTMSAESSGGSNRRVGGNERTVLSEESHHESEPLGSEYFTFAYPRKLKVNGELDAQINDALGELEANDTYEDDVKNFIIAGTCLYYKNYLLTSHMNEKDLGCLHCTLFCNGLLHLNNHERHVKNMIMWKRVYPKSHMVDNLYYNNSLKSGNTYYLLVYGRANFLLCTLLESNYFTNPNLNPDGVQPDIKLIRHAEEIINFLISTRNIAYLNKEIALLSLNAESNTIEPRPSDWTESLSLSGSYQSQSTLTDEEYNYRKSNETSASLPVRVLANSVLFYYVHVNKQDGVLLTPDRCKVSHAARSDPAESAVFAKFQSSVYKIEKVFKNYAKFKKLNSTLNSKPLKLNRCLICIKEAGVCFEIGNVQYWTLGRLYNHVGQVYVCYVNRDESVLSQNMIEIMFKLFLSHS